MSTRRDRQRSVNDRIRIAAAARGVEVNRLRRSLVFHRVLARLATHGFILKGGFCLEARLPDKARATKDVDLVGRMAMTTDPEHLLDALLELFENGDLDDGFDLRVSRPVRLRGEEVEAHAWRVGVTALLGGHEFERIKMDLVGQVGEVTGATELLTVLPPVAGPGWAPIQIEAVDVYQHAAEKYHAYARLYAHDRPSSRVKDLVDLVLLIESGLLPDPLRLRRRLGVVYAERDHAAPAHELSEPPANWTRPYAAFARELGLTAATTSAAHQLVADQYATALGEGTTT